MRPEPARRERGAAAVEFIGMIPVLMLAALIAFQMGVAGWTVVATAEAARDAARAASLGQNPDQAARSALPGRLSPERVAGSVIARGHHYSVEVRIPSVVPGISLPTVTRSAVMPGIES